ncbi:MAG TPA: branched-chain amino acid ABC transporter permease [Firmicutes bacterium]|nr:branched-chain amino acid ABC transporter permease [Bacillota bacterium]
MNNKNYFSLAVLALFLLILPWLLPNSYFLNIAVIIGTYTLMTIGLNLLIGYAGQISLGHAAYFGIGSYTVAILTTLYQWDTLLALITAVLLAALAAWIIGKPTLRLRGHYLAMATLGFGFIVQILMAELTGLTGGPQGISGIPKLAAFGFKFKGDFQLYFLVWGLVVVVQLMTIHLVCGKIGRTFLAIHTNETAAESLGINTARLRLMVFMISAGLAGLAGGFYAYAINYINPEPFGFNFSILLVTMVVVGGMGDLWGPLLGTVVLTIIPEVLRAFKDFDIIIYGLILMLIIIFMPQGLISLIYRAFGHVNSDKSGGSIQ